MKLLYKPVSILVSLLAGVLATAIFKKVWKAVSGEEETPNPVDSRRGFGEVLVAAALQGAIFSLVRAAVSRGAAEGTRRLTGYWPGEDSEADQANEEATSGKRA
jgi:hypothetical protein